MRTVTLEILRHGPRHGQLLSPLTPYLVLCGDHPPTSVHFAEEHWRLTVPGPAAWERAVDVADRALAQVPALPVELATPGRTVLRLVLGGDELALIPFEMARRPAGTPNAGRPLLLDDDYPVSILRATRRGAEPLTWPSQTRILLVAAAPASPVPLRAHALALRMVLDRWLVTGDTRELAHHVTVLPQASLRAVDRATRAAVAEGRPYTHVHVLAHGQRTFHEETGSFRHGLELHADDDPGRPRMVSGSELAEALATPPRPVVVTLASCDSAHAGSVSAPGAGASVAHHLHAAGIPVVIGAQRPLSMVGSAILVRTLYADLLGGEHPADAVRRCRRELRLTPDTGLDWTSLITYAALPPAFESELAAMRLARAQQSFDAVLEREDLQQPGRQPSVEEIEAAAARIRGSVRPGAADEVRGSALALTGSAYKRLAGRYWAEKARAKALDAGRRAHSAYVEARRLDERRYLTQVLALRSFLRGQAEDPGPALFSVEEAWALARAAIAEARAENLDPETRLAVARDEIELAVVGEDLRATLTPGEVDEAVKRGHEALAVVLRSAREQAYDDAGFDAYLLRRQLGRYSGWLASSQEARRLATELDRSLKAAGIPERSGRWHANPEADADEPAATAPRPLGPGTEAPG